MAGGLDGPEGEEEMAEWHGPGRPGGRTKKTDPAVDNPAVAVPKLKSKGNKRVEVGSGDKRLGRARVGEETVPVLHGHVERLESEEKESLCTAKGENRKRVENRMVRRGPEVEVDAGERAEDVREGGQGEEMPRRRPGVG